MMVLLNCLPPAPLTMPSAGLSILASYLKQHGIACRVVYWNHLLARTLEEKLHLPPSFLFPLLIYLLHREKMQSRREEERGVQGGESLKNTSSIREFLLAGKCRPSPTKKINLSEETIEEAAELLQSCVEEKLRELGMAYGGPKKLCIGVSARHDQWVSGAVLGKAVKRVLPGAYVIAGGFPGPEAGETYLSMDTGTDFTFWGEGEESLLSFVEAIGRTASTPTPEDDISLRVISPKNPREKNFREHIFPDYSDFMKAVEETEKTEAGVHEVVRGEDIQFPLEGIRGCHWNRCKFCIAARGIRYSKRRPESMANEIVHHIKSHGIRRFYFTDDDTSGGKPERLRDLCRVFSKKREKEQIDFQCTAWINPVGMDLPLYREMKEAGFTCLKTGHEANSDSLLAKMDKRNRFAQNILFLKAARHLGLSHQGGIPLIVGVPGETEEDLRKGIENLRFLRFFLNERTYHSYNTFDLGKGSRFYRELSDEERRDFSVNVLGDLLPQDFLPPKRRDEFLQFKQPHPKHEELWRECRSREREYREAGYRYSILPRSKGEKCNCPENTDELIYREFRTTPGTPDTTGKEEEIAQITLGPLEEAILRGTEERVVSMEELLCLPTIRSYSAEEVRSHLRKLLALGLIYVSSDETQLISVLILPKPHSS